MLEPNRLCGSCISRDGAGGRHGCSADARAGDRKRLTDLHEKATDAFDRAVMTLPGGALGVSLAFIHDVAPHPRHNWAAAGALIFGVLFLVIFAWLDL